ncbi:Uncharacterised protein [uncultured archaeon]|nr:Uncharacterised protein [uncultured archaeon]
MTEEELSEEEIQKEIEKKKLRWKAGKTSMSELSPEEQRKRLGIIPTKEQEELIQEKARKKKKGEE